MKLDQIGGEFVIIRGVSKVQYFGFFVDSDSSCWSKRPDAARKFKSRGAAVQDMQELKRRAKSRRSAGKGDTGNGSKNY